jgi:hypothetical protein
MQEKDYHGLTVRFTTCQGDYEGDPSEPRMSRSIPEYIDELTIFAPDGTEITEWFDQETFDEIISDIQSEL